MSSFIWVQMKAGASNMLPVHGVGAIPHWQLSAESIAVPIRNSVSCRSSASESAMTIYGCMKESVQVCFRVPVDRKVLSQW